MMDAENVRQLVRAAFANVDLPPAWALRGSNEGTEPYLLEEEFKDVPDWGRVDAKFIDQAPGGFSSALAFFSDEAFRYYLPAYLLADLDGTLERTDPVFYRCNGFGPRSQEKLNPRRYGARTWLDEYRYKFSVFDTRQARAIVEYLEWKKERTHYAPVVVGIEAAISFWGMRIAELEASAAQPGAASDGASPRR